MSRGRMSGQMWRDQQEYSNFPSDNLDADRLERALVVNEKPNAADVSDRGDFCFVEGGGVILSCPFCGVVFSCHHTVEQRDPLTLSPSVVGPATGFAWGDKAQELFESSDDVTRSQILAPCSHHFFIRDGKVLLHHDD